MNSKALWSNFTKTTKQSFEDAETRMLESSFEKNINYYQIYKDFDDSTLYDVWIYDDASERKDVMKKFIQMKPSQTIRQGEYIHWNGDIWICLGVDTQYENKPRGMIYQCLDSTIKWIDENGYHSFPIYSQSKVLRDPLSDGRAIPLVEDTMEAFVQKNDETLSIKENMRFVFGGRNVFKVIEVLDFYIDNTIKLLMKKDENRFNDDFVNGIADSDDITVAVSPSSIEGEVGTTTQLVGSVVINDEVDDTKTIMWASANEAVATVDANGLVTFVGLGSTTIYASYDGYSYNPIKTEVSVDCVLVAEDDIEYVSEPYIDKIVVGDTIQFTVNKYVNGTITPVVLTISASSVPADVTFTVDGDNTFTIGNVNNISDSITIICEDGLEINEFTYKLRAW